MAAPPPGGGVPPGWRVKVYQLNTDGQWEDQGTGSITCETVESVGGAALTVISEDDGRVLLQCRILDNDAYQRQGDNIITWCEPAQLPVPGGGIDLALSFQENHGCLEIWNQICDVQGKYRMEYDDDRLVGQSVAVVTSLPDPTVDNLVELSDKLNNLGPVSREPLASFACAEDGRFIQNLFRVFDECEARGDREGLKNMCLLFKSLICLNEGRLLEVLLGDDFFVRMTGVFEYDPELKERPHHREWFQSVANFKQVLPIEGWDVVAKIHQNFRVSFLKDILLRPMMDDAVISTLNSVTFFNNGEILGSLCHKSDYVKRIFDLLLSFGEDAAADEDGSGERVEGASPQPSPTAGVRKPLLPHRLLTPQDRSRREEVLMFLRELFHMSKTIQLAQRENLYAFLWNSVPLFESLMYVLADAKTTTRECSAVMEIVIQSLQHDPSLFRSHISKKVTHPPLPAHMVEADIPGSMEPFSPTSAPVASSPETCTSLLFWVIRRLTVGTDEREILVHASEICRMVLDVDTMGSQPDRDNFLGVFYDHYIHWLVAPFWDGLPKTSGNGSSTTNIPLPSLKVVKGQACDLLSFCVHMHTYRMKYFVLRNNVVMQVLQLLHYPEKYLQLSAIRFLRRCIGVKDDFYNRYIIKNNLLTPVFDLLRRNAGRDNLITSAIVEMVEFVKAENIKSLTEYIVERFSDMFSEFPNVPTFKAVLVRYDQNKDYAEGRELVPSGQLENLAGGERGVRSGSGSISGSNARGGVATRPIHTPSIMQNRRRLVEEDEDEAYFDRDEKNEEDGQGGCVSAGYGGGGGTEGSGDREEGTALPAPMRSLVPYDDEEEDWQSRMTSQAQRRKQAAATMPAGGSKIAVVIQSRLGDGSGESSVAAPSSRSVVGADQSATAENNQLPLSGDGGDPGNGDGTSSSSEVATTTAATATAATLTTSVLQGSPSQLEPRVAEEQGASYASSQELVTENQQQSLPAEKSIEEGKVEEELDNSPSNRRKAEGHVSSDPAAVKRLKSD